MGKKPQKERERGGVLLECMVFPPTLTIEDLNGEVGPHNSLKTENVAPVSRRKVRGRPPTIVETLGSCCVIVLVRRGVPRPRQSSAANPKRSCPGLRFGLVPLWGLGQSIAQRPCWWHFGHGLIGGLELGHDLAQCPFLPTLETA